MAETRLSPSNLMQPIFVSEAIESPVESDSLRGIMVYPPESSALADYVNNALDLGVESFLLFGIPRVKDDNASRAWARDGPVQRAIRYLRREVGWNPVLASDLCICGYTMHGHCGIPSNRGRGVVIDNDSTLALYKKIAVSQAEAGVDLVAPSGMMDGQVSAIRDSLDEAGFTDVGIMAYSVKYASSFYGPFRGVMESSPRFGDRSTYQMDFRNSREALKEVCLDLVEGADIVMVKPALAYLDIISLVKQEFSHVPLAAYSVSGEYMMVRVASEAGVFDGDRVSLEIAYAIKRAGADIIISYNSINLAKMVKG